MGFSEFAATAIYPTYSAITVDNDLRVVSMTAAAYDYLITLPAEYRLYTSSNRRSSGLILFVLIRYTSVIVLVVSNVGFFYRGFTPISCSRFYLLSPALKVVQMMVSQAILGLRTYNISQRRRWVGCTLLSAYIMATSLQWFSSLYNRTPVMIDFVLNGIFWSFLTRCCTSASSHPQHPMSSWVFYLMAMMFDCLTLSISTFYLMKFRAKASAALWLVRVILYDGLGYFFVLTVMNATNIIVFRGTDNVIQSTTAPLGYTVTWIMSQRILIHLHQAREEKQTVVVAPLPTSRPIASPLHFGGESRPRTTSQRDDTRGSPDECGNTESEFGLQVRVERSVAVDGKFEGKDSKERDFYESPKSAWEQEYVV